MSAVVQPAPTSASHPVATGRIDVERFDFWYGKTQALFDINLSIAPRAVTALIGPSGCGKSTFLRSINRLNELIPGARRSGEIRLDDENIYQKGMDVVTLRQRVGMVFPAMESLPQVDLRQRRLRSPDQREPEARRPRRDRRVGASSCRALGRGARPACATARSPSPAGSSSGLCIARALANDPKVLLLDEPASALDPIATQKVEELVYELKRELTIVIVTHNLQQAARISDQTAFFYLGRLVEMGDTQRLFTSPREQRTEAYITGRFG
jgi:phosphate transport system ATP-binding protein